MKTEIRNDIVYFEIDSELTINNIDSVKNEFDNYINQYHNFELNLYNIENIDISAYQLIYSLKKHLENNGKKITVNAEISDSPKKLLLQSGINL